VTLADRPKRPEPHCPSTALLFLLRILRLLRRPGQVRLGSLIRSLLLLIILCLRPCVIAAPGILSPWGWPMGCWWGEPPARVVSHKSSSWAATPSQWTAVGCQATPQLTAVGCQATMVGDFGQPCHFDTKKNPASKFRR